MGQWRTYSPYCRMLWGNGAPTLHYNRLLLGDGAATLRYYRLLWGDGAPTPRTTECYGAIARLLSSTTYRMVWSNSMPTFPHYRKLRGQKRMMIPDCLQTLVSSSPWYCSNQCQGLRLRVQYRPCKAPEVDLTANRNWFWANTKKCNL